MQYSFNNSRKIPKLTQFILGIYNNFYYKILGYFWGVTRVLWYEVPNYQYKCYEVVLDDFHDDS